MPYKEIPQEKIIEAYNKSETIKDLIINVGLFPAGTNYTRLRKECEKLNLDFNKFNKRKYYGKRYSSIEDVLVQNKDTSSVSLKKRLLKENYFEHKCYKCNLTEWNGKPIPIELEHISGDKLDNRLENLTILCPNCHAQTDTYRGKNAKKRYTKNKKNYKPSSYSEVRIEVQKILENNHEFIKEYASTIPLTDMSKQMGVNLINLRLYCKHFKILVNKSAKIPDFTKEHIQDLLSKNPMYKVAKQLGCSDRGLVKKCKRLGIEYKI